MSSIVFINQVTGYLMKDVINVFCKQYENVALIAGKISDTGDSLDKKVKVSLICPYWKGSPVSRFISWIWATIQTIVLVNFKYRGYHLFITSNPPTLAFLPLFCRNRYSVLVYDIYPDGLVEGGFIRSSSLVARLWAKRNRNYFLKASNIFTLTESMALTLANYTGKERIKVITPWSLFDPGNRVDRCDNIFINKHKLNGKFIVMYSGNIGLGHNLESVIETARLLAKEDVIKFVIIGDGWNKSMIEKMIKDYELKNCLVLPFQPADMLRYSLSAADLGIVSVSAAASKVCAPSKTYNLINLEVPILAISDPGTELASMVERNGTGKVFNQGQYTEMAQFILDLKNDDSTLKNVLNNIRNCSMKYTKINVMEYLNQFNNN